MRRLLRLLLLLLLPFIVVSAQNCRERRDIHDMPATDVNKLIAGFVHLYETRQWETFAQSHWNVQRQVHGCAQFLPFHRVFIHQVETALKQFDNTITMPYWNWTRTATSPSTDIVLTRYFGDSPWLRRCNAEECCIKSGPFANWNFTNNLLQQKCVSRSYTNNTGILYPWGVLQPLMDYPRFQMMAERLEQLHARVHTWVGGSMKTHFSPIDPLFFLHHAFVDKVWSDWQVSAPATSALYEGRNCDLSTARTTDTIVGFPQYTVRQMLDNQLCVQYKPNERSDNITGVLVTNNISIHANDTDWLRRNGFNQSQISSLDDFIQNQSRSLNTKITDALNNDSKIVFVPGVGNVGSGVQRTLGISIYTVITVCILTFIGVELN